MNDSRESDEKKMTNYTNIRGKKKRKNIEIKIRNVL